MCILTENDQQAHSAPLCAHVITMHSELMTGHLAWSLTRNLPHLTVFSTQINHPQEHGLEQRLDVMRVSVQLSK